MASAEGGPPVNAIAAALIHPCSEFFRLTLTVEYAGRAYEVAKAVAVPEGTDGHDRERAREVTVARMRAGDDWIIARMNLCIHTLTCETGCRDYLYRENRKNVLIFSRTEAA